MTIAEGRLPANDVVARLWVDALQRIGRLASHEMRGALNGMSLNVDVLRTRSAKSGPAASLAPFAENVAAQLAALISMTEGLVALVRPVHEPADIATLVSQLVDVLAPAVADGGSLRLQRADGIGETVTTVSGDVARLTIANALLSAAEQGGKIQCRVAGTGEGVILTIGSSGAAPEVDGDVAMAAAEAGLRIDRRPEGLTLIFPAL
jgi:signal transduction histidine kinase